MNTRQPTKPALLLAALLALPAGLCAAELNATQTATTAVDAATQASSASANAAAQAAANAQLAANQATANATAAGNQALNTTGVNAGSGLIADAGVGASRETRQLNGNADANSRQSVTGRSDRAAVDLNNSGSVAARLDPHAATNAIEATDYASREQAIAIAERGSAEGRMIAGAIENSSARLEASARADVEKAARKAEEARTRLEQAIQHGRDSTERRWDNARENISERYQQFSNALEKARETAVEKGARLEVEASGSVTGAASATRG